MKAFNWNDIRCTMKRTLAPPVPTAPEAFWNTFRLRAAMLPRRPVQAVAAPPRWFAVPGWALAVSCAVLFLAAAGVGYLQFAGGTVAPAVNVSVTATGVKPGPMSPEKPLSAVESVDVAVDYDSVMIVQDANNGGTLVMLAGVSAETDR